MQPKQNQNFVLFATLSLGVMLVCMLLSDTLWPRKPVPPEPPSEVVIPVAPSRRADAVSSFVAGSQGLAAQSPTTPGVAGPMSLLAQAAASGEALDLPRRLALKKPAQPEVVKPAPKNPQKLAVLGGDGYFLKATLDSHGAGVRSVILTDFKMADELGRPVFLTDDAGRPTREPAPMELVQESLNRNNPSHLLFHYPRPDEVDPRPAPYLGRENWEQVGDVDSDDDGQRIAYRATINGVTITKTYSLKKGDYHIGLEVKLEADREMPFRYQLTSAHGLPIEGAWYTYTFRNALVTRVDSAGYASRNFQEMRFIALRGGGDKVPRADGKAIQFGGIAVQFFASMVVVDNEQEHRDFLAWARPTVESGVVKGRIRSVGEDGKSFVLALDDRTEMSMQMRGGQVVLQNAALVPGEQVQVRFHTDEYDLHQVMEVHSLIAIPELMFDDINVRLVSDKLDLEPGKPVTHKYLLYNGPAKVRLMHQLGGDRKVDPALITRYEDTLNLATITDYHWANWWGENITGPTGLTTVLVWITNLMHTILWGLHGVVPNYGLNIIMLTILVRMMMLPFSIKQAKMQAKMQELAPELKKLQAKFGEDRQAMQMAQWELYKKHGVNPMGTCWLFLVQMPIFLGLYYSLSESIHFRLATFLWIPNLAAPDMLWEWGQQVPWISRPSDYGSMLYLGPFLNILPIVSMALMLVQQKLMMPPATNEEEETRNKTMLFMTVFMGLIFYKMPAGLCLYFIATTLWGVTERKLLPKKKPEEPTSEETPPAATVGASTTPAPSMPEPSTDWRKKNKKKNRGRKEDVIVEQPGKDGQISMVGKLRRWWREVLKAAEKKGR